MTPMRLRAITLSVVLFATLIPHLAELNYWFGSIEMLLATAVAVVVGTALAFICESRISFGIILGLLVYIFLDVFFVETDWSLVAYVWCLAFALIGLRYLPSSMPLAISIFALVFAAPSFFRSADPFLELRPAVVAADGSEADFAYLHIILDEQMSLTAEVPGIPQTTAPEAVLETYNKHDFRVYTHADSVWHMTFRALPAIFDLSENPDNYELGGADNDHVFSVINNALVDHLVDSGFSTSIIETNYLNICGGNPAVNCMTYDRGLDMSAVRDLDISLGRRLELAVLALHSDYMWRNQEVYLYKILVESVADLLNMRKPMTPGFFIRPVTNLKVLDEMADMASTMQAGDALIVHLLVPHFPYVYDRECNFLEVDVWQNPMRYAKQPDPIRSYEAFWEQSICVHSKIDGILEAMADRDDAVVIVHGDHGTRILSRTPLANDIDYRASMLALKGPMIEAEVLQEPVSLQGTFAREFEEIFAAQ